MKKGSWEFSGSLSQQYTQIGNAVPIGLGKAIGQAIQKVIQSNQKMIKETGIYTREDLLKRLVNRPRTMLNPPNMWKIEDREAARKWMNGHNCNRIEILEYVSSYQD